MSTELADVHRRVERSARSIHVDPDRVRTYLAWLDASQHTMYTRAVRVPLDDLPGWDTRRDQDVIRHESGRFFTIEGLSIRIDGPEARAWTQPIINQPDVGILGLLLRERDGALSCLVQAKPEPGNPNGLQVSPTVQATWSNYTGVHRGKAVPYVDQFTASPKDRIVVDVRQSEHGSVFLRKRNRTMVVRTVDDVAVQEGFEWLTLAELHRLLEIDDLVNMDMRAVLACLPWRGAAEDPVDLEDEGFRSALVRSASPLAPARHPMHELLHWITDTRALARVEVRHVPLSAMPGWARSSWSLSHHDGRLFDVIGVSVQAAGREVGSWSQPMVAAADDGVLAFLVARHEGVLYLLVQLRIEPGLVDVAELAPTVQYRPGELDIADARAHELLDRVLGCPRDDVRFDTVLSDEGGRFHRMRNRHLIVETAFQPEPPGYRWMTVAQIIDLLGHSHYVNLQARSLLSCLASLLSRPDDPPVAGSNPI